MSSSDPFLQVQQDVLSTLLLTRPLYTSYKRIQQLNPSSSSPELAQARTELRTHLSSLRDDLADLHLSVSAAERDPSRYGLSGDEVGQRAQSVRAFANEVETMERDVENRAAAGVDGLPDPGKFAVGDADEEGGEDGDGDGDYGAYEQQRQVEMLQEQDGALEDVFVTVGNLRAQASDMGRELEEQGGILGEVDGVADRVGGKLKGGVSKVGEIIRRNEERGSGYCIALLIFVLCVLLILVIAI